MAAQRRPASPRRTSSGGRHLKAKAVTLLEDSKTEERHPEIDPQTPGGAIHKLKEEAGEGSGLADKAKRAVEEIDRQIGGEYERREQPD